MLQKKSDMSYIATFIDFQKGEFYMSQHNSFKSGGSSTSKKRSVLKRFERIDLLRKRGALKTITRVTGLPKTKPAE